MLSPTHPHPRKAIYASLLLSCALLAPPTKTFAEGSKQLMQDTSSRTGLSTVDSNFANWKSTERPNTRLNIHIADPVNEVVHLGFSLGYSDGHGFVLGGGSKPTSAPSTYYYRIKDPAGTVVFGPIAVNSTNAIPIGYAGFQQIQAGPAALGDPAGYTGFSYIPAPGAIAGDYYIEFNKNEVSYSTSQVTFDYWDITVAYGTTPKDGRIWSKQWGFYSKDYSNPAGTSAIPYSGYFKGALYSYTSDSLVEKIDFHNSGFLGGSFRIGMNSTGPGNSGDPILDRQSR